MARGVGPPCVAPGAEGARRGVITVPCAAHSLGSKAAHRPLDHSRKSTSTPRPSSRSSRPRPLHGCLPAPCMHRPAAAAPTSRPKRSLPPRSDRDQRIAREQQARVDHAPCDVHPQNATLRLPVSDDSAGPAQNGPCRPAPQNAGLDRRRVRPCDVHLCECLARALQLDGPAGWALASSGPARPWRPLPPSAQAVAAPSRNAVRQPPAPRPSAIPTPASPPSRGRKPAPTWAFSA